MEKIEDDEPALLLANHAKEEIEMVLLNEEGFSPKLALDNQENKWWNQTFGI